MEHKVCIMAFKGIFMRRRLLTFIIVLILTIASSGCAVIRRSVDRLAEKRSGKIIAKYETAKTEETGLEERDEFIRNLISSMTLEEKVGQLFYIALPYDNNGNPLKIIDSQAKDLISRIKPGGIILFGYNFGNIPQTVKLIKDIKAICLIPPFIGTDEEGGRVTRLNLSKDMHATSLPSAAVLGKTCDTVLAFKAGKLLGEELYSLGINMDFAPVADINTNPANPVIGDRSFGSEPKMVANMVEAMVSGIQSQDVSAVLKHYPGHGDTSEDTHTGSVRVEHDIARLENIELVPFIKGMHAGVDAIMTAHIQVPKVTGNDTPASLSSVLLQDVLREKLGYKGIIITDALNMESITHHYTSDNAPDNAAVLAFKAGADLLLMPADIDSAYSAVLKAIRDGIISEDRVNNSVMRILKVKYDRQILITNTKRLDPETTLGCKEHKEIVKEILDKAGVGEVEWNLF